MGGGSVGGGPVGGGPALTWEAVVGAAKGAAAAGGGGATAAAEEGGGADAGGALAVPGGAAARDTAAGPSRPLGRAKPGVGIGAAAAAGCTGTGAAAVGCGTGAAPAATRRHHRLRHGRRHRRRGVPWRRGEAQGRRGHRRLAAAAARLGRRPRHRASFARPLPLALLGVACCALAVRPSVPSVRPVRLAIGRAKRLAGGLALPRPATTVLVRSGRRRHRSPACPRHQAWA